MQSFTRKEVSFSSDNNNLVGTVYTPREAVSSPGILFIHGAGNADQTRYFPWQEYLATQGICSFSFDVRGVGKSKGVFEDGSLNNRLIDAENALQTFIKTGVVDQSRLGVSGFSMGGHIAIRFLEQHPEIKGIILGCAAAYGKKSEDKKLNGEFTEVIRKEGSWKNAPVFQILNSYQGKVFVVYGEEERVIPQEIQQQFVTIAQKKGEAHYLPHMGHKLLRPENDLQKKSFQKMLQLTGDFLQKTL